MFYRRDQNVEHIYYPVTALLGDLPILEELFYVKKNVYIRPFLNNQQNPPPPLTIVSHD
jgi:hypothetical protein